MTKQPDYDDVLHMFKQPPCEPDLRRLRFLRHVARFDRDDGAIQGPPSGELAIDGPADGRPRWGREGP